MCNFVVSHDKHYFCAFLTSFVVFLGHSFIVLAKCHLPYFCCCQIMHQFFVTGYCFSGDWMYHWTCIMFEVNWHLAYFMSACGVCTILNDACSCKVRMLIACCMTRRWCAPVGGTCDHCCVLVDCLSMVLVAALQSSVMTRTGMMHGVLFLVTCLWRRLVLFNAWQLGFWSSLVCH